MRYPFNVESQTVSHPKRPGVAFKRRLVSPLASARRDRARRGWT